MYLFLVRISKLLIVIIFYFGNHEKPSALGDLIGPWSQWSRCGAVCSYSTQRRVAVCYANFRRCVCLEPRSKCTTKKTTETRVCRVKKCKYGGYDTQFEYDLDWITNWEIEEGNEGLKWETKSRGNDIVTPQEDHTPDSPVGENTKFLHVTGTNLTRPSFAILRSMWLSPHKVASRCLSFYYFISGGSKSGRLYVMQAKDEESKEILLKLTGQSGQCISSWCYANVTIPTTPKRYKIWLLAKFTNPGYSEIGLDDVIFDIGACTNASGALQDTQGKCNEWAEHGYCYTDKKYMLLNCPRSCSAMGNCQDSSNTDQDCWLLASLGYCKKTTHRKYVWARCCSSCRLVTRWRKLTPQAIHRKWNLMMSDGEPDFDEGFL